ncbi:MAG: GTPase ObgE [Fimbriimonadaceae bacterium]|nr:GTPase ObgE [Fimbriimonadaceae bacterium]
MFLDETNVLFESGQGGNGAASFHREKHVPRGGPNGADGGRGGDIILIADRGKRTLYDFQLLDHYKAENGTNAYLNKRGRDGKDLEIHVPVGTIVTDLDLEEVIADLHTDGMAFVVSKGGKGGRGNLHFTNSVRQAPTFAQIGAPAEIINAKLELKLLADVGLIGLPNAGKSTLLSQLSAAKPKIADYPFTTLVPNLGVVRVSNETFVMADLPGLIEGASEGIGLGHQFLKHAERNKVLLHVVDSFPVDGSDPIENFKLIEAELQKYSEELFARPRLIALNKLDLGGTGDDEVLIEFFREAGVNFPIFPISAAAAKGTEALAFALLEIIREAEATSPPVIVPIFKETRDDAWDVEVDERGTLVVTGKRIVRLVSMTDLDNSEAVRYLHRKLKRIGVIDRLVEMGAEEGVDVRIGSWEFTYADW